MLKRLQIFLGVVFGWIFAAFALPKTFLVIAAAILGVSIWHMVKEKKRHSAGMFFSTVGALTAAVAALGWLAEPDYEDYDDYQQALAEQTEQAEEAREAAEDAAKAADAPAEDVAAAEVGDEAGDEAGDDAGDDSGASDEERIGLVTNAIKRTKTITKGKGACTDPAGLAETWKGISAVQPNDKMYPKAKQAAKQLEKCRKKMLTTIARDLKKAGVKARTEFAKEKAKELAAKKAKVKTAGPGKVKLVIKWRGASQEDIDSLTVEGLLTAAEEVGFKQVQINKDKKNLSPTSEEDVAKSKLEEHGLAEPFAL